MIRRVGSHPPVVVERRIPHGRNHVFGLWRDPEAVARWMCPAPSVSVVEIDWPFREGRPYRIVMDVEGAAVAFEGEFVEIVEGERIVVTWISSRTDEQPTRVTVELSDDGDATLVRLTHELLPSASSAEDHREGWNRILAELEAFAAG